MRAISIAWQSYLDSYTRLASEQAGTEPAWLQELRQRALACFMAQGLPGPKDEDWKYTRLRTLEEIMFTPAPSSPTPLSLDECQGYFFSGMPCLRLVFVDGYFMPGLSAIPELSSGIRMGSLAAAWRQQPENLHTVLAGYADHTTQPFTALNTAFMGDGAYIYLPARAVLPKPVHLVFITSGHKDSIATHPRNLIVLEPESGLTVIEHYLGLSETVYFTNAVTEIVMGKKAKAEHIKLQEEAATGFHIATVQVQQAQKACFTSRNLGWGSRLGRTDINSILAGEGAECIFEGLYALSGECHLDNHTRIDHKQPHTVSREHYKGILEGKSRAVFNGKVIVHPNAQKVDARQINRNLLLSEGAEVDTKPELEIYADDVKCTHGATVGQLDKNQLFYLRSRGVEETTARQLLLYAFAEEIIENIHLSAVRTHVERRLGAQLSVEQPKEVVL